MIAGIDIGSRTTKLVVLDSGIPVEYTLVPTGVDPLQAARTLIAGREFEAIAATGYGRHLARTKLGFTVLTEVKACAVGAHHVSPECRTVIDIGGQDCKVVTLDGNGGFSDFQMNDKCAAGTGRFLEVMAQTLGFGLDEFGNVALMAKEAVRVNSMCTVFAESEITSLIARGEDPKRIARGLHLAVVDRVASMARSMDVSESGVLFVGGVAKNPCIRTLLETRLRMPVTAPEHAQFVVALGAALSLV